MLISLIVPSRGRPTQLGAFLESVRETAGDRSNLEVVLVRDEEDETSCPDVENLSIIQTVGPSGRTMGELNRAGIQVAQGRWIFLLNDDVLIRTQNWDQRLRWAANRFKDDLFLLHVNDTLMREHLCVFPFISRSFALRSGVIDPAYQRYRIDDHIEDIFLRLAGLGEVRLQYLPDVVVEHLNVTLVNGQREYHAEPTCLAADAAVYDRLAEVRSRIAQELFREIRLRELKHRLSRGVEPLRWDRVPHIATIAGFRSVRELNQMIACASSDFVWIARNHARCPIELPIEQGLVVFPTGMFLDRRQFDSPIFDERYRAYFFDLALASKGGTLNRPRPAPWWKNTTTVQYHEDRALFVREHPGLEFADTPPRPPGLLRRVWIRWNRDGWRGLFTSLANVATRSLSTSAPAESPASTPKAP